MDKNQYIMNIVKLSINPFKVVREDINGKKTQKITETPSKREIGIFLKHDPELISEWYMENGYHCIEIKNISFKEINELTQSEYFFKGHIVYVNYLSNKKIVTVRLSLEVRTPVGLFQEVLRIGKS